MSLKKWIVALTFYLYNQWIGRLPGYRFRRWYLVTILGYDIHRTAAIHMGCFFTGRHLKIASNTVINRNCYLDCRAGITIGTNASISPECYIISSGHDPQSPDFSGKDGPVVIDDYVWLGARAMILPGVILGKGSVAAAGSVVTRNVDAFTIVGGNPAKFIKPRNNDLRYQLKWFPYFNTDID